MADFNILFDEACRLSPGDRLKLIDALWESIPGDVDYPLHAAWASELKRRIAAIEAGSASTIPWTTIRDEALTRIGHGNVR